MVRRAFELPSLYHLSFVSTKCRFMPVGMPVRAGKQSASNVSRVASVIIVNGSAKEKEATVSNLFRQLSSPQAKVRVEPPSAPFARAHDSQVGVLQADSERICLECAACVYCRPSCWRCTA